jgi:hypothetical protein
VRLMRVVTAASKEGPRMIRLLNRSPVAPLRRALSPPSPVAVPPAHPKRIRRCGQCAACRSARRTGSNAPCQALR